MKGLPAALFIDICNAFVAALENSFRSTSEHPKMTNRQHQMAIKPRMFLSACAKVGLDAPIDEATGYQIEREADALKLKLAALLEGEKEKVGTDFS